MKRLLALALCALCLVSCEKISKDKGVLKKVIVTMDYSEVPQKLLDEVIVTCHDPNGGNVMRIASPSKYEFILTVTDDTTFPLDVSVRAFGTADGTSPLFGSEQNFNCTYTVRGMTTTGKLADIDNATAVIGTTVIPSRTAKELADDVPTIFGTDQRLYRSEGKNSVTYYLGTH